MKKITYLFGAGASAQAMPTVAELPTALEIMKEYFESIKQLIPQKKSSTVSMAIHDKYGDEGLKKIPRILQVTEALIYLVKSHASIDTLFKKIYLSDTDYLYLYPNRKFYRDELLSVYNLLLLFMEYSIYLDNNFYNNYKRSISADDGGAIPNPNWLYIKNKVDIDLRYDAFLATILEKAESGLKLPDNIKIVTWNYDIQLERALIGFIKSTDRNKLETILRYCKDGVKESSFFKLNGSSLIFDDKGAELNKINTKIIDSQFYDSDLISAYLQSIELQAGMIMPKHASKIFFEWDNSFSFVREECLKSISETDVLVVIGYSFPTFNRNTDRQIFKSMSKLKKVYIQNHKDKTDELISSFRSLIDEDYYFENNQIYTNDLEILPNGELINGRLVKTEIETIPFTSQFFIPPEF